MSHSSTVADSSLEVLFNFLPIGSELAPFYKVVAVIKNSINNVGWRSEVYSMAASAVGFYHIDKASSIYYQGNDLHVVILFTSMRDCASFLQGLHDAKTRNYLEADIEYSNFFEQVRLSTQPTVILKRHYSSGDYAESPEFSLGSRSVDTASCCDFSNPTAKFLMIERPDLNVLVGLDFYTCHLMSKAKYPSESKNPNNILRLSHPMHQRFDGLNTRSNRHLVPQIAINFVRYDKTEEFEVNVGYMEKKDKVTVSIEFPDTIILLSVGTTLKQGSVTIPDDKGLLYSFVHVDCHVEFKRCLTVKYLETTGLWQQGLKIDDPLPQKEREVSRKSARLAVKF